MITESGLPARWSVEEENELERGLVLTQHLHMVEQTVRGPIRQKGIAAKRCVQVSIAAVHNSILILYSISLISFNASACNSVYHLFLREKFVLF